jgi:hypothetical protein
MLKKLIGLLCMVLFPAVVFAGVAYYVKPDGDNGRDGRSVSNAFKTLQYAADRTEAGDTVYVMNGTYGTEFTGYSTVLTISRPGTPGNWTRYRAYPGHKPLIHFQSYCAIGVRGASYIEISGFEIRGDLAGHTVDYAIDHQFEDVASLDNDGITIGPAGGFSSPVAPFPSHVMIRGNYIHHCGGSGIGVFLSDYVTVDSNSVNSCVWFTPWAKSGINIGWGYNADTVTSYKHVVTRNTVYDCEAFVKWRSINGYSDGNGLIFDSFNNHDRPGFAPYAGRTLVANNVSYNNGGSGMHAFRSRHIDFINNTAYYNSRSPHLDYPCIGAGECYDVRIYNNIMYARPGEKPNSYWNDTSVVYDYNIYYGGVPAVHTGPHDLTADPLFANPGLTGDADFRLQATSPAIDFAYAAIAPSIDITGSSRPSGSGPDAGAYEFVPPVRIRHMRLPIENIFMQSRFDLHLAVRKGIFPLRQTGSRMYLLDGRVSARQNFNQGIRLIERR